MSSLLMPCHFELEQCKIGFFTGQIEKADIHVRTAHPSAYQSLTRSRQELDDLEDRLSEHENRLLQMNNSHETMQRRYLELTELKHVLRETSDFFQEVCFFLIHQWAYVLCFKNPPFPWPTEMHKKFLHGSNPHPPAFSYACFFDPIYSSK